MATVPSEMTKKLSPGEPSLMIFAPFLKVTGKKRLTAFKRSTYKKRRVDAEGEMRIHVLPKKKVPKNMHNK
jgi:hypothetical protein